MLFESKDLQIDVIAQDDLSDVVDLYNSNTDSLLTHTGVHNVTSEWVRNEWTSMSSLGFTSCKALDKTTKRLVGIIDFKVDEESYLSLLMVHSDYANRGLGKQIYRAFGRYVKSLGSKRIRLDVVTGYSDKVINFWRANGFRELEDILLNWKYEVCTFRVYKARVS